MRALAALLLLALPVLAAPVPKAKVKTTEQKLIGKWRMVKSDTDNGVQKGYDFYVIFKEKGEFELRYEYEGDIKPRSYLGTYKVLEGDKIDYTVHLNGRAKTEVLTIDKLTDTEVSWTDPDKLKESLERVNEEEKKDK
jgi:uncharacterized protein (TIGR03066 family)